MKRKIGFRENIVMGSYLPIVMVSMVGIIISCLLTVVYTSRNGTDYTILQLLFFKDRSMTMDMPGFTPYDYWAEGIGLWTKMLLPFFIGICECVITYERKKGNFDRWLLLRQGRIKLCLGRCLGAFVRNGMIMAGAYLLFGIIVYSFFGISYVGTEWMKIMHRMLGIFLYGAFIGAIPFLCCTLFSDKYILMCFPLLIKYMYDRIVNRFFTNAMSLRDQNGMDIASGFELERIIDLNNSSGFIIRLAALIILYILIGFIVNMSFLRGESNAKAL